MHRQDRDESGGQLICLPDREGGEQELTGAHPVLWAPGGLPLRWRICLGVPLASLDWRLVESCTTRGPGARAPSSAGAGGRGSSLTVAERQQPPSRPRVGGGGGGGALVFTLGPGGGCFTCAHAVGDTAVALCSCEVAVCSFNINRLRDSIPTVER